MKYNIILFEAIKLNCLFVFKPEETTDFSL